MAFTSRSEAARTAILDAVRDLLARKGFAGTTIRAVAAEASVDPSMVMRYYGSKEDLLAAALDVDLHLPDPAQCRPERLGRTLAEHMISRWEGQLADGLILMLLRSASNSRLAAQRYREMFESQVLGLIRAVIGDTPDTARRAGLVAAQAAGVALCRYVLEIPPVAALEGEELAALLAPVLQHYLTGNLTSLPLPSTLDAKT
ncbi:TetR family transcriptional regulator [Pseudonocardia spinosispora]|uniref:TetR/AcrR family transcriptional regulator n=1 Tax=Pseudonocardia spinosispora TaxID=103441 RepID=UPI00041A2854|nr:TetR family transcriptional regulator [Pseudonocardia spinosispora]